MLVETGKPHTFAVPDELMRAADFMVDDPVYCSADCLCSFIEEGEWTADSREPFTRLLRCDECGTLVGRTYPEDIPFRIGWHNVVDRLGALEEENARLKAELRAKD